MRTVIIAVCVLMTGASSQASEALTPCEALGGADAVFIGVVGEQVRRWIREPEDQPFEATLTKVVVERGWRGISRDIVFVTSNSSLRRGERLLFYGVRYAREPEAFMVEPANGLLNVKDAAEHLAFLDRASPGSTIYGTLEQHEAATDGHAVVKIRMPGVPIRISSEGFSTYIVTNGDGSFVAGGLPPGTYAVDPTLPEDLFVLYSGGRSVAVRDGGCAASHIRALVNGRVRGRVLAPDGKPLALGYVDLVPADVAPDSTGHVKGEGSVTADSDGRFEFPARAPGRYYLGVNLSGFPHTYYPGTANKSEAIPIEVGRGTVSHGYEFAVGPPVPATWVDVVLSSPQSARAGLLLCVEDLQDRKERMVCFEREPDKPFRLPVLEGLRYRLHAHLKFPGGQLESEPAVITGLAGGSVLRLTLDSARQIPCPFPQR